MAWMVGTRCRREKKVNITIDITIIIILITTIIAIITSTQVTTIIANDVMVVIIFIIPLMDLIKRIQNGHQANKYMKVGNKINERRTLENMVLV